MSRAWTRRRVDIGGLTLNVRELGSDGPTMVMLHGLGVSGAVWQGVGRLLHPTLRLVAPDLRGHGESDKPSAGYLPRDYVGDLVALLSQELATRVVLLGHSLGAVVAALLAAERPELIEKLILVDPPFDPERPRDYVATVRRLRHAPPGELERYLQQRESGMSDLYARAMANLFRAASDGAFDAVMRAEPGYPAVAAALGAVVVPTLLIAADAALDGALGEARARQLVKTMPNSRLLLVPGARHAVHATHPRELAETVLSFVTGADKPTGIPRQPRRKRMAQVGEGGGYRSSGADDDNDTGGGDEAL